jgi:oligopeptidase B
MSNACFADRSTPPFTEPCIVKNNKNIVKTVKSIIILFLIFAAHLCCFSVTHCAQITQKQDQSAGSKELRSKDNPPKVQGAEPGMTKTENNIKKDNKKSSDNSKDSAKKTAKKEYPKDANGYPLAKEVEHVTKIHGKTLEDPWFWMRNRKDPDTIRHLKAENSYTKKYMKDTKGLQDILFKEIKARIKEDDRSVPVKRGEYYYYHRTEDNMEYPIYCRAKAMENHGKQGKNDSLVLTDEEMASVMGPEEIILDLNICAEDQAYCALGSAFMVSPDHKRLAYSLDFDGSESYTMFFRDLEKDNSKTGADSDEKTVELVAETCWSNDSSIIYYVTVDENKRPYRLYRHVMGNSFKNDELLFEEKDEAYFMGLDRSRDRKWLFLTTASSVSTEVYALELGGSKDSSKESALQKVWNRQKDVEAYFYHSHDQFYVRTNMDDARNFKLLKAPVKEVLSKMEQAQWQTELSEHKERPLMDLDFFSDFMVIYEMRSGLDYIRVKNEKNNKILDLTFPEKAYAAGCYTNPDYNARNLLVSYESMTTPESVFSFDMETGSRKLIKQYEVLGGYDAAEYEVERVMITATDGTKVPVSMVYKKSTFKKDGSNPAYLYAYGSYGICSEPGFYTSAVSLLDRGFIYAIAHVRGSSAMGFHWHDDGKMLNKRNTFLDFINVAEYLVKEKYTSPEKLSIEGGSAGGLLMGAVSNMRPDLFGAVIADVPFVDVINTMLDDTLPLTVTEYDEWGNPNEKPYFDYMMTYCPYSNVKAQKYPHMLVLGGLNDPRVSYWEPAKLVAKIRKYNQSDKKILLKTNMDAGHGGASGRYEYYKETAFKFAFILKSFGIK